MLPAAKIAILLATALLAAPGCGRSELDDLGAPRADAGRSDRAAQLDGPADQPDAATGCMAPPPGRPGGGGCPFFVCDPTPPDGGNCYGVPRTGVVPTSFEIWIEDRSLPGGGSRIDLPDRVPVTVGGHVYENKSEGLTGMGSNGFYGDVFVAVDGVARQLHFHYEGFAQYRGAGVWDWPATVTRANGGRSNCAPPTVGRHFTITRTGTCPPSDGSRHEFVADEPPRGCGCGVDLLRLSL